MGKPELLLHQLRNFVKLKETEIEDLCKVHYEEFIHAVDELRGVLVDAHDLKNGLASDNAELQHAGNALLGKLDELIESHSTKKNITEALDSLKICSDVMNLCVRANEHINNNMYYPALKLIDSIERDYLTKIPAHDLRHIIERQIPIIRVHIEKSVNNEFSDWLVQVRSIAREIGQQSVWQASSARKREMELRSRQREAEELSRYGGKECLYILETEDPDEDDSILKFDLTPVYRAYHIHACLGLQDQFQDYYYKNRQLQLNSDLQVSSSQSFLEQHQTYFAQIAGFFIVEDRILRTAGDLITNSQVEILWEIAVSKMISLVEDQFSRMQTANHLLIVKDYVSLLCATLRRYGYQVGPLLDILDKNRDKYHELLLTDCKRSINESLANDSYEKMIIRKEYEYRSNILAFHLQTTDILPAFPFIAPFSATVPDCCRIVKTFIEDSVSFLAYGSRMDFYDVVKKYLDKLLINVLNEALLKLIQNTTLAVSHAMQIAANMTVLEQSCDFFARYAAQLCGIPVRLVDRPHASLAAKSVLLKSQGAAHEQMLVLVKTKVDEFMQLTININWTPEDPPYSTNEYLNEVIIYLETIIPLAQQILPLDALDSVVSGVLLHISEELIATFLSEDVQRFNIHAIMGIDADLKVLESHADQWFQVTGLHELHGATNLRECLLEARQLINLLLTNQPENFLNPVIRLKSYSALDSRKVLIIAEKYKDLPEKLFSRNPKNPSKKKSMDLLVRRLRDGL
ncbi:hypothetical protein KP509_39G046000 [Ceratopteris richardii]|nr:hypothetical protein KP509_39G046000 [Ceratopteris richardii]